MFTDQNGYPISAAEVAARLEAKAKQLADQLIALEFMTRAHQLAVEKGLTNLECPEHREGLKNYRLITDESGREYKLSYDNCCDQLLDQARGLLR